MLISNADARRLFMERHGLAHDPRRAARPGALLDSITALGFVQLDSIRTVERAHHMILFARHRWYRPEQLARLVERDRALFESWTHDAAVIPMAFYPYWRHRFGREREALLKRWRRWQEPGFEAVFDEVVAHIRREGAVAARALKTGPKRRGAGWWDWHPSKIALEYLWRTGVLAVCHRTGFEKVYDLAERVVPAGVLGREVDAGTYVEWCCSEALARLGFATSGEIAAFWDGVTPAEAAAWCERARADGRIVDVAIECADGSRRRAVAPAGIGDLLDAAPAPPAQVRVLSPFDPMIRDRKRTLRLFGFDYRIEVFVPEAQRRYGYYVFPLLEGARMIGRIDMRADRDAGVLRVRAIWPERGVRWGRGRRDALMAELERQRRFCSLERIELAPDVLKDG